MEGFTAVIVRLNAFVWGLPMMVLLVGISLYFTFKLGFLQRHLAAAIVLSLKNHARPGLSAVLVRW